MFTIPSRQELSSPIWLAIRAWRVDHRLLIVIVIIVIIIIIIIVIVIVTFAKLVRSEFAFFRNVYLLLNPKR